MKRFKNEKVYMLDSKYKICESKAVNPCIYCIMNKYKRRLVIQCCSFQGRKKFLYWDCKDTLGIRIKYDNI